MEDNYIVDEAGCCKSDDVKFKQELMLITHLSRFNGSYFAWVGLSRGGFIHMYNAYYLMENLNYFMLDVLVFKHQLTTSTSLYQLIYNCAVTGLNIKSTCGRDAIQSNIELCACMCRLHISIDTNVDD